MFCNFNHQGKKIFEPNFQGGGGTSGLIADRFSKLADPCPTTLLDVAPAVPGNSTLTDVQIDGIVI